MPAERFYFPSLLQEGKNIIFVDTEFHHLIHVMRVQEGETIEIINGQGQLACGGVERIQKKGANILLKNVSTASLPDQQLILIQALPRLSRLEWILEKGTELGATEFQLFHSARSDKRQLTKHQIERLETILISSIKQCGRLFLPKITFISSIEEWPIASHPSYFGDTTPEALPLLTAIDRNSPSISICIGPESGFSTEETSIIKQKGFIGVKLHSNILRTDTAAISALSLISAAIY